MRNPLKIDTELCGLYILAPSKKIKIIIKVDDSQVTSHKFQNIKLCEVSLPLPCTELATEPDVAVVTLQVPGLTFLYLFFQSFFEILSELYMPHCTVCKAIQI